MSERKRKLPTLTRDTEITTAVESPRKATPLPHRTFVRAAREWKQVSFEELKSVTLGEVMLGEARIMMELTVDGEQKYFLTHDEDMIAMQKKYPDRKIYLIGQIFPFFVQANENSFKTVLPKVMLALDIFKGAKVVEHSVQ